MKFFERALYVYALFVYCIYMNTLWITRMCAYTHTEHALLSAENIIMHKVAQQFRLVHHTAPPIPEHIRTISDILLYEARSARVYWRMYAKQLPHWTHFVSRKARHGDVVNTLLDIGYHHLNSYVTKLLATHDIPSALALMHIAKTNKSKPLVYDLMELFRADLVDPEVLRYVRLKKKAMSKVTSIDITKFLRHLNKRMDRKVYIREFKQCHTYRYSMELHILKYIYAVNHDVVFKPMALPSRHESRCS